MCRYLGGWAVRGSVFELKVGEIRLVIIAGGL